MKDFITYTMRYEDKKGIIQNGYGDWCPPGGNENMECPPELTSTAFFYKMLDILEFMAQNSRMNLMLNGAARKWMW